MIRAALLGLLLTVVATAPAQAGVRADAERLVRVYLEHELAVDRAGDSWEAEFDAQAEACSAKPPDSLAAMMRELSLYVRGFVMRTDVRFARLERRLKRFETSDRRLRRVARAMARSTGLLRALAETSPETCSYLEAWKAAGWSEDFRVSPPVRNFSEGELAAIRRDARIVRRALPRLRRLGASPAGLEAMRANLTQADIFAKLAL